MFRMYMMHQKWKWEDYLPLVEFTYNNGYQESLRISPFKASYRRSFNTPISWSDPVYLRIKPKKSSLRIGSCAKLAPQFCGSFNIIERIGSVTYRLALPPTVKVHDVFNVSLLKKYVNDVDHVIDWYVLKVEPDGELQLEPQCIFQKKVLMLWNQAIKQVKVQWKHFGPDEATCEMVDQMQAMYPSLFGG
eukprot:PITA_02882